MDIEISLNYDEQAKNIYPQKQQDLIVFMLDISNMNNHEFREQDKSSNKQDNYDEQSQIDRSFNSILKNISQEEDGEKKQVFYSLTTFDKNNVKQIDDLNTLIKDYNQIQKTVDNRFEQIFQSLKDHYLESIDFYLQILNWIKMNGTSNIEEYYELQNQKSNDIIEYPTILYENSQKSQASLNDLIECIESLPYVVQTFTLNDKHLSIITNYREEICYYEATILKKGMMLLIFTKDRNDNYNKQGEKELNSSIKKQILFIKDQVEKNNLEQLVSNDTFIINRLRIHAVNPQKVIVNFLHDQTEFITTQNPQELTKKMLEQIVFTPSLEDTQWAVQEFIKQIQYFCYTKKTLFIISDGKPIDQNTLELVKQIKAMGVMIVACSITEGVQVIRKQLYSKEQNEWDENIKILFNLCSEVSNFKQPLCFLSSETSFKLSTLRKSFLFIQTNNLTDIREFFGYIAKVKDHTDAWSILEGDKCLKPYLKIRQDIKVRLQSDKTCCANSISTVYQMALKRIFCRQGGYPSFKQINQFIIHNCKPEFVNSSHMLPLSHKKYRLNYKQVNIQQAKLSLLDGRPLLAGYLQCNSQLQHFSNFFQKNPKGILSSVGPYTHVSGDQKGHAAVFVGYEDDYLLFLNNWGASWGDEGYFRLKDENVLLELKFYDVFWTLDGLRDNEKRRYEENSLKMINAFSRLFDEVFDHIDGTCKICNQKLFLQFKNESSSEQVACLQCQQNNNLLPLNSILSGQIQGEAI